MRAATQRFTENGRPATIRRFFSNVIVAAVDYASAEDDDKPITIRFCRWPSDGDAGACSCCLRRDGNAGGRTDDGRGSPPVRAVVAPVRAQRPTTRFATVRAIPRRQRRARRPLRHGVTLAARAAQCMSAAAMPCRYDRMDHVTPAAAASVVAAVDEDASG